MSCEFISELRRLSKLSAEAVQNLDHFDPLKKYMHITRHTEILMRKNFGIFLATLPSF